VNISQEIKNVSKGQEYTNNAFMTQYPQGEEFVKEKTTKIIQKTKADKEGEQKLQKCLDFLGIKDKYMLDMYDPNFKKDLEEKTRERLAESKALMPSYEA